MIYLDNAATTFPKPPCVSDEICRCLKNYCGNPGRSSHSLSIKSAEKIFEVRELLAKMFGGKSENVVFTYNTTYALNIAIKGYIKPYSHILISDIEHNSVLRPVVGLAKKKICTYDIFSSYGTDEEIIENIKKSTNDAAVASTFSNDIEISHIEAQKGLILAKAIEKKGLDKSEVIVLGDSFNDYSMFTEFKNSFAMENAIPEVKKIAKYITDSNNNDGVAKAIYKALKM